MLTTRRLPDGRPDGDSKIFATAVTVDLAAEDGGTGNDTLVGGAAADQRATPLLPR
jgi:hypothetical protein